jgi:predicted P-loop ATPase
VSAALDIYANEWRWVAWRNEARSDNPNKITKVPYSPRGGKARADDPLSWGTRPAAEACAKQIVNGQGGGIGIELGELGNGLAIGGVDLDTCRTTDGQLEPWAVEIVNRFASYTEISPSDTGVKIFFHYQIADLLEFRAAMGGPIHGREFKRKSGGDHPPAIELHLSNRYFTVTEEHLAGTPAETAIVPRETVLWLLREAGPAFARTQNSKSEAGNKKGGQSSADNSRSGIAFRLGQRMRREGKSFQEFCECLKTDPETANWYAEKGTTAGGRELKRIWGKTERNDKGWRSKLILNRSAKPCAILANAITAFREAPEWEGRLLYDVFSLKIVIRGDTPWPELLGEEWTSAHDVRAAEWLQHQGIFVSPDIAGQAIEAVARRCSFHPVREYLDRCKWDGTARLDNWVIDYLGAANTTYARAVGSRWMISAVARVDKPGCKADCALILEGPQGLLKSTALKTLASPWFTDEIAELGTKDAAVQLAGVWIIELAELDSMARSDVSRIKAFISRSTDRFRPPYGRRLVDQKRQCVFAGTVNDNQYLRDETGGRRFWPIACTKINIPGLAAVRDQLWAEACHRFHSGEPWWLDNPRLNRAAEKEQQARYQDDAWGNLIAQYIAGRSTVTVGEVLTGAIRLQSDRWTRADQMRVAAYLKLKKWVRKKNRPAGAGKPEWGYVRTRDTK